MIQAVKIGYAGFNTLDVEAMLAYYTQVIGLTLVERGDDGAAYLRSGADHHTIVLYPATERRLRHTALQIEKRQSLKEVEQELRAQGISVELQTDAQPGIPELLEIADPAGNSLHLYTAIQEPDQQALKQGIVPEKLSHVAISVNDVKKTADFYQSVLGFRVSDWIEDFFVFLRCGPDHHTLNFARAKQQGMNHIAFQLEDWSHVQRACDHLSKHSIPLQWGPGRHGPGHNIFTYHYDPDKNIVELSTQLDIILNEELGYFEPRPWHRNVPQKPKIWKASEALNFWGTFPPPEFMSQH